MTGRDFAKVWALAFSLVAAAIVFLTTAERIFDSQLLKSPIVAIGSSLTAHAIPVRFPEPNGLLGDGRAHARVNEIRMSEDETLSLVSRATEAGASTVLVEANAFAFDFAYTIMADEDPWIIKISKTLEDRINKLRRDFKWLSGYEPLESTEEPGALNNEPVITRKMLSDTYPLHLHLPRDPQAIAETLNEAHSRGTAVILISYPRSQTAANYIGERAQAAIVAHLRALADGLGVPLFMPSPAWPDEYFIDTGHLNARGRARFVAELAAWWAEHAWHPKP
ncbi:MAG TPA: hypothetical protein VJN67_16055 [Stellaceae bacterium]|nr:hypothetical protein [Stellaceae bacterium]